MLVRENLKSGLWMAIYWNKSLAHLFKHYISRLDYGMKFGNGATWFLGIDISRTPLT